MDDKTCVRTGKPRGRRRKERTVAELARAIGQELVEFADGSTPGDGRKTGVYTNLERLVRMIWASALAEDQWAQRCLLEYMEGKPVPMAPPKADKDGGRAIAADEMATLLSAALARIEAWKQSSDR